MRNRNSTPVTRTAHLNPGLTQSRYSRFGQLTILVVDDEATILETVEHKLRREGFSVFTAPSAEDGMRLFRQVKPDLLILDVMLPHRSGFDLCKAVRRESQAPIIFLTAKAAETRRMQG